MEYWAESIDKYRIRTVILFWGICMFLAGCAERQEETEELVVFEETDKECESNSAEELPGNTLLKIDYHLFDFNDDGLEDYVVCLSSSEYSGSAGNTVYIYIQEPDGKLSEVTV